jgi:hypothetical protein
VVHRIGRIVLFSLYVPIVSPVNKFMCIVAMQAQIVSGLESGIWGGGGGGSLAGEGGGGGGSYSSVHEY